MTTTAVRDDQRRRKGAIGTVLVFIGLPVVLDLVEAVSFYALNRSNGTIVSSGLRREYLLHVPTSYDRTRPTPLVPRYVLMLLVILAVPLARVSAAPLALAWNRHR